MHLCRLINAEANIPKTHTCLQMKVWTDLCVFVCVCVCFSFLERERNPSLPWELTAGQPHTDHLKVWLCVCVCVTLTDTARQWHSHSLKNISHTHTLQQPTWPKSVCVLEFSRKTISHPFLSSCLTSVSSQFARTITVSLWRHCLKNAGRSKERRTFSRRTIVFNRDKA